MLVEPACGAALAAIYCKKIGKAEFGKPVIMVVCGGNMASLDLFEEWKQLL